MSRLLVGFDSAWTATNAGGLVAVIQRDSGVFEYIEPPKIADFPQAAAAIRGWQCATQPDQTLILIDQPTIVQNPSGQRPVENIVSAAVSRRYGGMQPSNTGRAGMFDGSAPIWPFLADFGGASPLEKLDSPTCVLECYPVLSIIARSWCLPDSLRATGRLPKYNPASRRRFKQDDWDYLCNRLAQDFARRGLEPLAEWMESITGCAPKKALQDRLDACICLLVAIALASGEPMLAVGEQVSGLIVAPYSAALGTELKERCESTQRDPAVWVRQFFFAPSFS